MKSHSATIPSTTDTIHLPGTNLKYFNRTATAPMNRAHLIGEWGAKAQDLLSHVRRRLQNNTLPRYSPALFESPFRSTQAGNKSPTTHNPKHRMHPNKGPQGY